MPPVRTLTAAKPIKTERTHEENQERYVAAFEWPACFSNVLGTERTLLHLDAAIEVSKLVSNPPGVLPKYTRGEQDAHCV